MKQRILIINTGGTIGMQSTDDGFRPAKGFLRQRMSKMPELEDPTLPDYEILEYEPLLDSANFTPSDWQRIATDIAENYENYAAFLVLHGTDTMAYTASALSLMLQGLEKNIILTGSQLPLSLRRNDARENIITAMILASEFEIPEVCICFGSFLLRGCRATKISATSFDAFDSPNDPPLGTIGTNIRVYANRIRKPDPRLAKRGLRINSIGTAQIATFQLFPGVDARVLENVLRTPLQGLVLETYGTGNGPTDDGQFLDCLRNASERGVVIVNRTQCKHGGVSQTDYATGKALHDAGVISGFDITVEAAITKLMYLFSRGLDASEVRNQFQTNMVGEMTY